MVFAYTNGFGNWDVFNAPLNGITTQPGYTVVEASSVRFAVSYTNSDTGNFEYLDFAGSNFTYQNGFLNGGWITQYSLLEYFSNPPFGLPTWQYNPLVYSSGFDATNIGGRLEIDIANEVYGGDDTWFMSSGAERAKGYNGNDTIYGFAGYDTISGDGGDDRLFGATESFTGGPFVSGGFGYFIPDLVEQALDISGNVINGGGGGDLIVGGDGNDFLAGDEFSWTGVQSADDGRDALFGLKGDDYLEGGLNDDLLVGGEGADILIGGDGDDYFAFLDWGEVFTGGADTIWDFENGDAVYLGNLDFIGSWFFDYLTLFSFESDSYAYYDPTGSFDVSTSVLLLTMTNYTEISEQDFVVDNEFVFF